MSDLASYAVMGGLLLLVVTALAVVYAKRAVLIRRVGNYARSRPALANALRPAADTLYPEWRSDLDRPRTKYSLEWRIREVRRRKNRFVVVGGIYLDLVISPVDVDSLNDWEFNNLDSPYMGCGGSARYFGYYLYRQHRQKSDLFSRVGSKPPFGEILTQQLAREKWIARSDLRADHEPCAVSVHLLQRDHSFYTTFTNMGSLARLEWQPILAKVLRRTRHGGVLYISGYFRTNLGLDLAQTLRGLSPKLLICIDHGRFRGGVNQFAEAALTEAFARGLIDVYICTMDELHTLMRTTGKIVDGGNDPVRTLEKLAPFLPPITVVRSNTSDLTASAYVLYGGKASHVVGQAGRYPRHDSLGIKNAFNAAFVYALATGSPETRLADVVGAAAKDALNAWAELG
jgi:sugar/nucleoside kinase (ribokinase family)